MIATIRYRKNLLLVPAQGPHRGSAKISLRATQGEGGSKMVLKCQKWSKMYHVINARHLSANLFSQSRNMIKYPSWKKKSGYRKAPSDIDLRLHSKGNIIRTNPAPLL